MAHPVVIARIEELRADPVAADRVVDPWLRRFTSVADRPLRRTVLRACLDEADDGSLLGGLLRVEDRAMGGEARARWLATELALTPSVVLELPYERLVELYDAAVAADLPALARRLLHDRRRPDTPAAADNPHLDASAGLRTALARRPDRNAIDRLARDRDPRVIRALLDNPGLTERDAVRIAAARPTPPEVLQAVAAHPRWAARYPVRKALAFNPYTPAALARQLLPTLLRHHLREIAGSHVLSEELRGEVARMLER